MTKARPPGAPAIVPRHFLKEWREFRGLGQRALAKLVDTSHVAIGRYERYEVAPDTEILARIAAALNTDIPSLLARHPEQTDGVWDTWMRLTDAERQMLVDALRGISRARD